MPLLIFYHHYAIILFCFSENDQVTSIKDYNFYQLFMSYSIACPMLLLNLFILSLSTGNVTYIVLAVVVAITLLVAFSVTFTCTLRYIKKRRRASPYLIFSPEHEVSVFVFVWFVYMSIGLFVCL